MKRYLPKAASKQLLIMLSALIIILFIVKFAFYEDTHLSFLIWNLFLAWIPLLILYIISALPQKAINSVIAIALFFFWLIFYPNAPYLITDLVHIATIPISLTFNNTDLLSWLKITLIFLSIWLGILLSFYSLYPIHNLVKNKTSNFFGKIFVIGFSIISSYGIYIGRFTRLNSWDLFSSPKFILSIIKNSFQIENFMFIVLFSLTFYLIYNSIHILKHNK
jgi:uncharacterized membrane protein